MKFIKSGKVYGELIGDTLFKFNQKEKFLMWSKGGVPAFNKEMVDKWWYQIKRITVRTDKGRTFRIGFQKFIDNAEVVQYEKYEKQYVADISFWDVRQKIINNKIMEDEETTTPAGGGEGGETTEAPAEGGETTEAPAEGGAE